MAVDSWGSVMYGATMGLGYEYTHTIHTIQPTVPAKTFVRCEYCNIKNKVDAPFCQQCGAPLPD